jgi:hypothetical protein
MDTPPSTKTMTVADLIQLLTKVKDKTLPVYCYEIDVPTSEGGPAVSVKTEDGQVWIRFDAYT